MLKLGKEIYHSPTVEPILSTIGELVEASLRKAEITGYNPEPVEVMVQADDGKMYKASVVFYERMVF